MSVLFKPLGTTKGRACMTDASPVQRLTIAPKKHVLSVIYEKHL